MDRASAATSGFSLKALSHYGQRKVAYEADKNLVGSQGRDGYGVKSTTSLVREVLRDPLFGQALDYALRHLGDLSGKVVVDAGCGDGTLSAYFALLGATVIGVDKNLNAIEKATERIKMFGLANRCQFLCESVESMTLRHATADVVFSRSTMQYVDRAKAVNEYGRILKTNGALALLENLPHNPFIQCYRLWRQARSRSEEQREYLKSIRGYLTHQEIEGLKNYFGHVIHQEFHVLSVFSIYPLMFRESRIARCAFNSMSALDGALLRAIPFSRHWAWFTAVICRHPRCARRRQ